MAKPRDKKDRREREKERDKAKRGKKHTTPAKRARLRRDPAIAQPPPRVTGTRTSSIRNLKLKSRGRTYPISEVIEADTSWSLGMDQAGTFALPIRDPDGDIVDILADESNLQEDGVRVTLDKVVYCVTGFDADGEGLYTLTLEDETAWRLRQFSRFRSANRKRTTRYAFIQGFADEASRKPYTPMRTFIPEIDDKRRIRRSSGN